MWSRSKIAALERGEKAIGLEDLVILAAALGSETGKPLAISDLFAGSGSVTLTEAISIDRAALRRYLSGKEVVLRVNDSPQLRQRMSKVMADLPAILARQELLIGDSDVSVEVLESVSDKAGEAEARVAKALRLRAGELDLVSARLWGRTLTEERDARVGSDGNQETLRAKRGRTTRVLMDEIRAVIEGVGLDDGKHPEKG